ncbi:hypothetical protein GWI33_011060 [Rhynchophorus ferrugineus]|uniref:PH domain-containing protein n=1 Tax=Rhynchophorus ferrugineus TaxID=354439 RepID=A0A834IAR3_RHYFE|nr:hypothetical protein GWI33_011060 [Rhynchophorus ferrugineus]
MEYLTKTFRRKVKPRLQQMHDGSLKSAGREGVSVKVISQAGYSHRCAEEPSTTESDPYSSSEFSFSPLAKSSDIESSNDRINTDCKSSDSGLCNTPGQIKKNKRIHFSPDHNSIHKYEKELDERYCSSDCCPRYPENSITHKRFKLAELPTPQRPRIITLPPEARKYSFRTQYPWKPRIRNTKPNLNRFKTLSETSDSYESVYHTTPDSSTQSLTSPIQKIKADVHARSDYLSIIMPLTKTPQPKYTEIVATSSPNIETSSSTSSNNSSEKNLNISEPIYAQVAPKSVRDSINSSIPSTLSDTPDPVDLLCKETREKLNLIHKTDWSLTKCSTVPTKEKETTEEQRFIVNTFESRPSKRWNNHARPKITKIDTEKDLKRENTNKNTSRGHSSPDFTSIFSLDYDDVDDTITKLEQESRDLKEESMKIQRELARFQHEELERHYNILDDEKKKIDSKINGMSDDEKSSSEYVALLNESRRLTEELELIKHQTTAEYKRYLILKKARDIECVRMSQASNALVNIKSRTRERDWLDVLIAERLLLETSERVKLYTNEIRETMYSSIQEPIPHKARLRLSDISFPFHEQFSSKSKADRYFTDFFVVTISHGTQMEISEYMTGEEEPLSFSKTWMFDNVSPDFEIKVKLFCLRLRTMDEYVWDKMAWCTLCPTSRIIYEDLLTRQYEEKRVYKTSFKLCAEVTLTRSNIDENTTKIDLHPEVFGKLDHLVRFNLKCEQTHINANLSGFLDFGIQRGDVLLWERKWCVLRTTNLYIYSYPQDEYLGNPFDQLNLEFCFGSVVTNLSHCPKKRSFQLKTGRPTGINCNSWEQINAMRTKPNFFIERYYFAAPSMVDYVRWTEELEKILNSLNDFKKLVFKDEYVQYQSSSTNV